jgi:hypothetical protein
VYDKDVWQVKRINNVPQTPNERMVRATARSGLILSLVASVLYVRARP